MEDQTQRKCYVLRPFFREGMWTFVTPSNDYPELPTRTLVENSLVSGMDALLEDLDVRYGSVSLTVSNQPFPRPEDYLVALRLVWVGGDRVNEMGAGNDYEEVESGKVGWLCPVLFDYFPGFAPKELFIGVSAASTDEGVR